MATLSTHVLDTSQGRPAMGLAIRLEDADGHRLDEGVTDRDGRVASLGGELGDGVHRLVFDTGGYFEETGAARFYPEVVVTFTVTGSDHYHVPLLLNPYGYSTYRGS